MTLQSSQFNSRRVSAFWKRTWNHTKAEFAKLVSFCREFYKSIKWITCSKLAQNQIKSYELSRLCQSQNSYGSSIKSNSAPYICCSQEPKPCLYFSCLIVSWKHQSFAFPLSKCLDYNSIIAGCYVPTCFGWKITGKGPINIPHTSRVQECHLLLL